MDSCGIYGSASTIIALRGGGFLLQIREVAGMEKVLGGGVTYWPIRALNGLTG
jgi:hypothetical protein